MPTNWFFAFLFIALSITMVAQAEKPSEGSAVAPVTPHQRQAIEGTVPGTENAEESKPSQDEATQAVPSSPHQEHALKEPAMQFSRLDQTRTEGSPKERSRATKTWPKIGIGLMITAMET